MFFYLSKIAWLVLQSSCLLAILSTAGAYLYWRGRERAGLRILFAAAVTYAVGGVSPVANMLILPLEEVYPRGSGQEMEVPKGFIILGGAVDTIVASAHEDVPLTAAAERLTEAVALARRFPQAKIVFSDGDGALAYRGVTEAEVVRRFFAQMGIDLSRVALSTPAVPQHVFSPSANKLD